MTGGAETKASGVVAATGGVLPVAVLRGGERGLEGGGRKVDPALQHAVEEAGVGRAIAAPGVGVAADRPGGEERSQHGADPLHGDRHPGLLGPARDRLGEPAWRHRRVAGFKSVAGLAAEPGCKQRDGAVLDCRGDPWSGCSALVPQECGGTVMGSSSAADLAGRSDELMVAISLFNLVGALALWLVLRLTESVGGGE